MTEQLANDQAIESSHEDRFGVDPFARALAAMVRKMQSPRESVIGLNGPWGSRKTGAVQRRIERKKRQLRREEA